VFPSVRPLLFDSTGRPGYSQLKLPISEVKAAIFGHAEFTAFNALITSLFEKWKTASTPRLKGISAGNRPKELIEAASEELLEIFLAAQLLNPYDVYQHLMDYWAEIMQDDVYLLVQEGWKAVLNGQPNIDLIPALLIINRYYSAEQTTVEQLERERDAIIRQMEELDEEHGAEEGLLVEAKTDKGKLTAKSVKSRLMAIKDDADAIEERKMLDSYAVLIEQESEANKKVKNAQKLLDTKVAAKYDQLSEAEIKTLVVEDKWLSTLAFAVQSELDRVSQALASRIRELAERYATPLPKITSNVAALATLIDGHLKRMGMVWN
jgi:type I restriction enzyme M protein